MESAHDGQAKARHQRIAERAYLRAERRGFAGGDPVADWIDAEREVDAELDGGAHIGLIDRIEDRVEAARAKLKSLNKKVSNLKEETRLRRERDLKRLKKLKDTLEKRLAELRDQGEHASAQVKEQAEKIWVELGELLHEIGGRGRGPKK